MIDYSNPWFCGPACLVVGFFVGMAAMDEDVPPRGDTAPEINEPKSGLCLGDLVARMADEANLPVATMAHACKTLRRHPGALRRLLDFPVHAPPPRPLPGEKLP